MRIFDFRRESSCDATCWRKTVFATSDSCNAVGNDADHLVLQPLFQPQQHLLFRQSRFNGCHHCRHVCHFNDVADSGTTTRTTVTVICLCNAEAGCLAARITLWWGLTSIYCRSQQRLQATQSTIFE